MTVKLQALPPKEAIKYFRSKGYKISFDWQDVWQEEHAHAFTVAKAMRTDILQDIRRSMDSAIAEGTTLQEFKKQLKPTLQEKGWWGRKLLIDPKTGEEKEVQLGSSRRLRTIFDTNMRSAYAAGRWERIERVKKTRPYLRYIAVQDNRTRDKHRQWHNTILPVDHPFWQKFYPPNGWHCRCSVQQLSKRDLDKRGLKVTEHPPSPPDVTFRDKNSGRLQKVPKGIDPGFNFNIGKARMKTLIKPPLNAPLDVPFMGSPAAVPMPGVRKISKSILYPAGLSDAAYVNKFLKEFDAKPGQAKIFTDIAGENIAISDDLFKTAGGKLKLARDSRFQHLGLLATTIKDPDEIWWVWEEYPAGRMTLRRKYLSRWNVEGENTPAFVLFDTGDNGWNGVTTFKPKKDAYLERQRKGALVYR